MNSRMKLALLAFLATFVFIAWALLKDTSLFSPPIQTNTKQPSITILTQDAFSTIHPIPDTVQTNPDKVALGKKLFLSTQLSPNNSVSCATCHNLSRGGTDHQKKAIGFDGRTGDLNTPTVFNAVFNFSQNWDGSARNLEAQMMGPLFNPNELANTSELALITRLSAIPEFVTAFARTYQTPIRLEDVTNAIAEFQKTLITPNSRFDQYLKGDVHALSFAEKEGYQLFKTMGCVACHNGKNVGGNMYQKAGVFRPLTNDNESIWPSRFTVTHKEKDKDYVKVPSLRNIAVTGPYLHDGSVNGLSEMIDLMAQAQLGQSLTNEQNNKIRQFLFTLTGKYQGNYIGERH